MQRQLQRLMDSFFNAAIEPYGDTCWRPSADVYRGDQGWLVKFDLAGVRAEDIQLRVEERRLIVAGVRRDFSILEHQQAYSMEISYNRFQRALELPFDLTQADIQTEFRDGMLLVLIRPRSTN
jgi:HSP20 family protein